MWAQVDFLDTREMEWLNPAPGIFSKPLSRTGTTGGLTALNRVLPNDGYKQQPSAHCHQASEEILVVKGMLSFDSRSWLHPGGYVFHPPHWVHGFKSNVPDETWFISRLADKLEFTYLEDTPETYPYSTSDTPDARSAVIVPSPWASPWTDLPSTEGRITEFVYGDEQRIGGRTSLRRYRPGAIDPVDTTPLARREEFYVMEGRLEADDGRVFEEGCYACLLPGSRRPRFTGSTDSLLYHHAAGKAEA